jgi:hypothetical protein
MSLRSSGHHFAAMLSLTCICTCLPACLPACLLLLLLLSLLPGVSADHDECAG